MKKRVMMSDIVDAVAQRCGAGRIQTDQFVRLFFEVVTDNLVRDKIVKVRGLGNFKLVDVEERTITNATTGERTLVPAHSKLSFTPDPVLRDEINKPFADFETTPLYDDTDLDEINAIGTAAEESSAEPADEPETTAETVVASEETVTEKLEESAVVPAEEPAPVSAEEPVAGGGEKETDKQVAEEVVLVERAAVVEHADVVRQATVVAGRRHRWHISLAVLAAAVIFFALGYFLGSGDRLQINRYVAGLIEQREQDATKHMEKQPRKDEKKIPAKGTENAGAEEDTPARAEEKAAAPVEEEAPGKAEEEVLSKAAGKSAVEAAEAAARYPQVEGGEFVIVGEIGTDTMKVGRTLLNISSKYYGKTTFVEYICVMNGIKNPDIVPKDMVLRLPRLVRKE